MKGRTRKCLFGSEKGSDRGRGQVSKTTLQLGWCPRAPRFFQLGGASLPRCLWGLLGNCPGSKVPPSKPGTASAAAADSGLNESQANWPACWVNTQRGTFRKDDASICVNSITLPRERTVSKRDGASLSLAPAVILGAKQDRMRQVPRQGRRQLFSETEAAKGRVGSTAQAPPHPPTHWTAATLQHALYPVEEGQASPESSSRFPCPGASLY